MAHQELPASGRTQNLTFSGNGAALAAGNAAGAIQLWLDRQAEPMLLEGHSGELNSFAFSADGALLVSGGRDGKVIVWNVRTAKKLQEKQAGPEPGAPEPGGGRSAIHGVLGVHVTPDHNTVVTIDEKAKVTQWNLVENEGLQEVQSFELKLNLPIAPLAGENGNFSLAFAPDGLLFATGDCGKIRLLHASSQCNEGRIDKTASRQTDQSGIPEGCGKNRLQPG